MVHPEYLINIARIPALRYLIHDKGLRIGALTSFQELQKWILIREKYTALFEAARSVSRTQIKNMGTVGGNLCNASPAADSAPPLLVLGGKVKLVGGGPERVVPLEDFYVGPGKTVLSPKELLVEVQLPESKDGTGSAFLKVVRVAADPAKLNVAVAIERENDVCRDCRIALGSVAPKPFRTIEAEDILKGKRLTMDLIEKTSQRLPHLRHAGVRFPLRLLPELAHVTGAARPRSGVADRRHFPRDADPPWPPARRTRRGFVVQRAADHVGVGDGDLPPRQAGRVQDRLRLERQRHARRCSTTSGRGRTATRSISRRCRTGPTGRWAGCCSTCSTRWRWCASAASGWKS